MVNLEELYEWIDCCWPIKRHVDVKAKEKEALAEVALSEEDEKRVRNKIEITIEDFKSSPRKIPSLISVLSSLRSAVVKAPAVSYVEQMEPQEEEPDHALTAFKEIFDAWPENEKSQNEKFARHAFMQAVKQHSLEDVKKACDKYIQKMNDPSTATVHFLGIKRFVSDDEILEDWIQKATVYKSDYDTSLFEAAYAWYPDFKGKNDPGTIEDSLIFYKRFIKENDCLEFYAAVKSYELEMRDKIREFRASDEWVEADENKFVKKFVNFIRVWKKVIRHEETFDLLYDQFLASMKARNIPYQYVYPEGEQRYFTSALMYTCVQKDREGNERSCVVIVTELLEILCNYLTTGQNQENIAVDVKPDYTIVSEVIAKAKELAKVKPAAPRTLEWDIG